jgi:2,4-dienoyl-CoA reductase-like NADH-dependent reductase (Old Yellow Enzyme family)
MSQSFPHLFSPLTIGPVELKNRTVFTGHATNLSTDGHPSDALVAYQRARARGGAGLIVTQVSNVHPSG